MGSREPKTSLSKSIKAIEMKTSKQDFEFFKKECEKWVDRFKLDDWKVVYDHEKIGDAFAETHLNIDHHKVNIVFNTFNEDQIYNREDMAETAKHEVIHILLGNLTEYANSRFVLPTDIIKATEGLIQKLLKIIK